MMTPAAVAHRLHKRLGTEGVVLCSVIDDYDDKLHAVSLGWLSRHEPEIYSTVTAQILMGELVLPVVLAAWPNDKWADMPRC